MTPFKFGKKKNKEGQDTLSSPSSKHKNNNGSNNNGGQTSGSPQSSSYSNSSAANKSKDSAGQGLSQLPPNSSTAVNSPQFQHQHYQSASPFQPGAQHQYGQQQQHGQGYGQQQQGTGVGYDHNNNIYNQRSPQRQQQTPKQQQQQTPQQQFGYSPQGSGVPPSRYQQHQQPQQPQQLHGSPVKQPTPWSRSKLMISPFPRYRHAASQFSNEKGEIFVMGGLHNTSVYGDTWIIKPDAEGRGFQTAQVDIYDNSPAPRVGHAATTCGNAFVVFGGDTVTNEQGEIDNDLYLFNMNSHTWTIPHPIGRKPSGRYGHSIGVIAITNFDSKIYLYGGQLDDTIYSDLVVFNLSSFRRPDVAWEWVTPADSIRPPPLTNHTMDVYDNKLWIFGGSNGKTLSSDLWSYDPQENKWDKHKTFGVIPTPVEEHASVIYKDFLIVYGGKDVYGEALSDVLLLNLVTKTWFKLPNGLLGQPRGKYGHSISLLKNDKLLILGGHLPDYANMGDNLEPSIDDNGVGTLLNTLDLSNLEKLVPGFQQYSTPGNLREQERFQGPQSIFTPPQQSQNMSPQKNVAAAPSEKLSDVPSSKSVAANAAIADVQKPTTTAEVPRVISAEDVFQREREAEELERKTPQKSLERQRSGNSQRTPSGRGRVDDVGYTLPVDEEDLPLQIPSPVRSAEKPIISDNIPKDDSSFSRKVVNVEERARQVSSEMPGAFEPVGQKGQVSVDDFQTPSTSPSKDPNGASSDEAAAASDLPDVPSLGQLDNYKRDSDFLDNYVNGKSTPDLLDHEQSKDAPGITNGDSKQPASTIGSGITTLGAGVAAIGATAASLAGISSKSTQPAAHAEEVKSSVGDTDIARNISINSGAVSPDEKNEFKRIIDSLSKELESLKTSTNEQVKTASSRVQALEAHNAELKRELETRIELPSREDDSEIKRQHIKLNTDYQLLNQEHSTLKSKSADIETLLSSNLFDLQKFNQIIKEQSLKLDQQQKELDENKLLNQQLEELQFKYDALSKEHTKLRDAASNPFLESQNEIKSLTSGLDTFLNHYLVRDETTGEYTSRSIAPSTQSVDENVTTQLRAHIDELLKENEGVHLQKKSLETDLEAMKSTQNEVEALKAKVSELTKIEENYKESLHSVNTATRALQLSQSELAKEKELTSKLQHEIDELKLFRAKKGSRNATPIIAQKENENEDDDDDVANAHYNLKIRDLQAELYIIKKERDDLKDEAMNLKKKLYNVDNPSDSF